MPDGQTLTGFCGCADFVHSSASGSARHSLLCYLSSQEAKRLVEIELPHQRTRLSSASTALMYEHHLNTPCSPTLTMIFLAGSAQSAHHFHHPPKTRSTLTVFGFSVGFLVFANFFVSMGLCLYQVGMTSNGLPTSPKVAVCMQKCWAGLGCTQASAMAC